MSERDVKRLGDLLGPLGKKLKVDDPVATGALWKRWPAIVGEDMARHAEPTSLKDGVLRVRTSSAVWATELTYLAEDLKRRVNDAAGKGLVREIKVWTSPEPIRGSAAPSVDRSGRATGRSRKRSADDPFTAFRRAFEAWSKRRSGTPR